MNPTDFLKTGRKEVSARKSADKRKAKVARKRAKLEAMPWEDRDDLVQAEYEKLKKLKGWPSKMFGPLTIYRGKGGDWVSGHAKAWNGQVHITIGRGADKAHICEVLVHELCHQALSPWSVSRAKGPMREGHSERFCSLLIEMVEEAYGVRPGELPDRGHRDTYAYAIDDCLRDEMRKVFPPSERAAYWAAKPKRAAPKPPACFPGQYAVLLTPTAVDILSEAAVGGWDTSEGCYRVLKDNPRGYWYRARRCDWEQASDHIEDQIGYGWTQNENGDSIRSKERKLEEVVRRIRKAVNDV